MKTIKLTVAQALIRFLNQQYLSVDGQEHPFVHGIFAIFGHGNVLGIGQALEENAGHLKLYQGRNEQGMAHAAIAFAKQNHRQKIIACTTSVGPGAANMVTAAATATANRIPLLLLPGDIFATRQPDPVLQQIEQSHDLSISTNDAFRPVSKYWDRITRPEQLMTACIHAMRVLTDPAETGTVTLSLPQDVQGEPYDYPDYFFEKRVHYLERRQPTAEALARAHQLLSQSQTPLIICGGGVKYAGAVAQLLEFAEKHHIPIAETQAGKGCIPSSHHLNVGGIGETGCLAANSLAKKADLIIGVGTRYTDFTTASKWLFQQAKFININISRFDVYKLDALQVFADAKATFQALNQTQALLTFKTQWHYLITQAKQQQQEETDRVYQITFKEDNFVPEIADATHHKALFQEVQAITQSRLTQSRALGILNTHLPEHAVVVAAAGSLPGDLQRAWRTRGQNDYHVEYGYSCMGYEINGALGVKLAEPEREVYAFVGDGSFMMLHSELVTSIQEQQKINIILFDNMANGCINNLQIEHGMNSYGTEFRFRKPHHQAPDGQLIPINFAQIAQGYGCKTWQVRTPEELETAFIASQQETVSTLIDIKVLPKTMIHRYLSWWRVGGAQVSTNVKIEAVAEKLNEKIHQARAY